MLVVSSDAVVFEAARETMLDFNPSYPNLCCYAWETMKDGAPGLGQKGISGSANFFVIVYDVASIPNKHGGANEVPSANPHPEDSNDEDDSSSSSEDASDSSEEEASPKKNKSVVAAMKAAMKKRSARRS